jgi:hypothetical protein
MFLFLPNEIIQYILEYLDCISMSITICSHPIMYYNKSRYWNPPTNTTHLQKMPLCFSIQAFQYNNPKICLYCYMPILQHKRLVLCTCIPLLDTDYYLTYHSSCISHLCIKKISRIQSFYHCPICYSKCIGIAI